MPEENITEQAILIQTQENKAMLEKIYQSTEKTRKLFLWTLIISVVAIVLPLVGLVMAIPYFLKTMSAALSGTQLGL